MRPHLRGKTPAFFAASSAVFLIAANLSLAIAYDPQVPTSGLPTAQHYGATLYSELKGVVSWKTLAQVEPVKESGKLVMRFSDEVRAMDRKPICIQGFMLPLESTRGQKHFLVSAVPPSCPYCMPAGPEATVEVFSKTALAFSDEPIIVSGTLTLVKDDPSGMLYRLTDAELVPVRLE